MSSVVQQFVQGWLNKVRKYVLTYRDGFYEMPYLANSPAHMIESVKGTPFVKFFPEKNCYTTSNTFFSGDCHYQELEEGLWIVMSNIEIKKNLSFKLVYDLRLPQDYHFLNLYINRSITQIKSPMINVAIENEDRSWVLFKAGAKAVNTHFKGAKSIFLSIYFSKDWLSKNVRSGGVFGKGFLNEFFKSDEDCLYLPSFLEEQKDLYVPIVESLLDKGENGVKDPLMLKIKTLDLIRQFVAKLENDEQVKTTHSFSEKDRRKLHKAENYLRKSVIGDFPGISSVARVTGMSETKLKSDFKKLYGKSLYQYFSYHQMLLAKKMLDDPEARVQDVAYSLGYTSASKFSKAFQKWHGVLPSEVKL